MTKTPNTPYGLIISLGASSLISVILLFGRIVASDSMRFLFLVWNLILAALAPLIAWWLVQRIHEHGWLRWKQIILTIVWLSILPNSFYLITDYVHVRETFEASLIFDISMMTSFVLNGLVFGYISVYLVHSELLKRLRPRNAWLLVGAVFLASSFAIYLGRYTRWNSWDLLLRPAGLLFDVSDRFINPAAHRDTFETTLIFFALLLSFYIVVWQAVQAIRRNP